MTPPPASTRKRLHEAQFKVRYCGTAAQRCAKSPKGLVNASLSGVCLSGTVSQSMFSSKWES